MNPANNLTMITLMPRTSGGFGSVLRRRNSKSYDPGRRDSFCVSSSYSLPTAPDSIRRYSSYEELGPLVQQMLGTNQLQPESRLKSRRSSITRLIRRNSVSREAGERKKSCDALDLQLAKVKEQLAQMRSQDRDMTQRVEELSSSVQELWCKQQPTSKLITHSSSAKSLRVIEESQLETRIIGNISEDDTESEEDDQSFEDYLRTNIPLIGDRRASSSTTTCTVFPPVEIIIGSADDEDPKQVCNSTPYSFTRSSNSCLVKKVQADESVDTHERETVKSECVIIQTSSLPVTPVH